MTMNKELQPRSDVAHLNVSWKRTYWMYKQFEE